jgi:hypothetical protein
MRLECLGSRFTKNALSYKIIIPMTLGTGVYQLTKTGAELRLATLAGRSWLSQGLSRKFTASFLGTLPEIPVYAMSSQGLQLLAGDPLANTSDVLKSTAVTLGLMKPFVFAGHRSFARLHRVDPVGLATRHAALARWTQPAFSQTALFANLWASHQLEEHWGLRRREAGATFYTDIFESMVSLGIGAKLGHQSLGRGYERFQRGLQGELWVLDLQEAAMRNLRQPRSLSPAVAGMTVAAAFVFSPELAQAAVEGNRIFGSGGINLPEVLALLGAGIGAVGMVKGRRGRGRVRRPIDEVTTKREQTVPPRDSTAGEDAVPVEILPSDADSAGKVDLNPLSVPEPVAEDVRLAPPPVPLAREASDSVPDTKPQFISVAEFSAATSRFEITSREERAARTARYVACQVVQKEVTSEGRYLHFTYGGTVYRMPVMEELPAEVTEIYLDPALLLPRKI